MNTKKKLTSDDILNKEFSKNVKGYDPLEVDRFLDDVIASFSFFETRVVQLESKLKENQALLEGKISECSKLQVENVKLKNKLQKIEPLNNVSSDNLDLLRRIDSLEKALYKLGEDPSKIK